MSTTAIPALQAPVPGGYNIRYEPVKGSRLRKAEAEAIGPVIASLINEDDDEEVWYSDIVEAARDPDNPMHKRIFGESDDEAIRQRRLTLARHLVRSIELVWDIDEDGETYTQRIRAFHPVEIEIVEEHEEEEDIPMAVRPAMAPTPRRAIRDIAMVIDDPLSADQLLTMARNDVQTFLERYENYRDIVPEFRKKFPDYLWRAMKRWLQQ